MLEFGDGSQSVEVFKHSATVNIGTTNLPNIVFGLICGSLPPPKQKSPNAILGLGVGVNDDYPSLPKQLLVGFLKLIEKNIFALYLKPKSPGSLIRKGELLLGGGDQTLYDGPLEFVPTLSEGPWMVHLRALQPENGEAITVAGSTILDTGSNYIFIPHRKMSETMKSVEDATAEVVGEPFHFEYDRKWGIWKVDCSYREFLPSLYFILSASSDDVVLRITNENYIAETTDHCYLLVMISPVQHWIMPDFMLVGHYLEFHPDDKKVGIGKLQSKGGCVDLNRSLFNPAGSLFNVHR
ncbi:hypothetical protein FOL47_002070 [Perkinsus chesapeaki]|uniref:Peptidase A1 domain-containing protein n=1 Tax=Perkinsus chesapeaki TaxID=330153 RepID=A0A7J6MFQ0_PERCH|nr:hypothetical protein FOL47_002070 [Perkinsus chesapeaki]